MYIYIYVHICTYTYMYIYVHIHIFADQPLLKEFSERCTGMEAFIDI